MAHTIGTLNGATISNLLKKLSNPDADFRFMSLNDLYELLSSSQPGFSASEYMVAAKTVDGILKTLDDTNGEVQNLAIKW
jgi:cullin-associated NEDD8-dissociated protein 1